MSELRQILELWRTARERQEEICLATVVRVKGSSYRKPGARMLLTSGGRRAGTISGGCLEAEVSRKAWWLTERGAALQEYSSFFDEESQEMPYGLGCGGSVILLLERGAAAAAVLAVLDAAVKRRVPGVIISAVDSPNSAGTLLCANEGGVVHASDKVSFKSSAHGLIRGALSRHSSAYANLSSSGAELEVFVEYIAPPPALFIFGAGDDAQPLAAFAHALGWYVTVADARPQLARQERFPLAERVMALDHPRKNVADMLHMQSHDSAVLMTHSYEQDRALLAQLLPLELGYLGILGPVRRTQRLLSDIAPPGGNEKYINRLHSPVGLDLGAKTPAEIALSVVAEIQATLNDKKTLLFRKEQPAMLHG